MYKERSGWKWNMFKFLWSFPLLVATLLMIFIPFYVVAIIIF